MPYRSYRDLITASLPPRMRDVVDSVHKNVVLVRPSGDDDAATLLKARDDVLDGGAIQLTPGNFRASELIALPDNVSLIGSGPSTLITFTKAIDVGFGNTDIAGGNSNIYIGNMRLDGSDLCNDPIELNNCTDSIIENVWVTQGNHDGIELQSCARCIVSKCIAHDSNTWGGLELDSCTDCTVTDCISYNNNFGIEFAGTSNDNMVTGGLVRNCTTGVITGASTSSNVVMGTHIDSNTLDVSDGGSDNILMWTKGSNITIGGNSYKGDYMFQPAPPSAPTDGNIPSRKVSFYLDEVAHELKIRVRYSDGTTLRTGTVALV